MKGKTIFGSLLMLSAAIILPSTNFHPAALIYGIPIFLIGLALIIFNKQEWKIEQRKDKK